MSDFVKCECPHCGQAIEFPAEGAGQIVPCPTCSKLMTLPILRSPENNPKILDCPLETGEPNSANNRATATQMEKLRFFGCTWDDGISSDQAEDALMACAKAFPEKESIWQKQVHGLAKYREKLGKTPSEKFQKQIETKLPAGVANEKVECGLTEPTVRREGFFCGEVEQATSATEILGEKFPDEPEVTIQEVQKPPDITHAECKIPPRKVQDPDVLAAKLIREGVQDMPLSPDAARQYIADPRFKLFDPENGRRLTPATLETYIQAQLLKKRNESGKAEQEEQLGKQTPEVTIREAHKSVTSYPSEYKIPAREVQDFVDQQIGRANKLSKSLEGHVSDLKSPDAYVRKVATVALGRSKNPLAVKPLISCLEDREWGVRVRAARSLGELGGADAVDALILSLKDGEASVRREVVDALGKTRDFRAIDALNLILHDRVEYVRSAAVSALAKITGQAFTPVTRETTQRRSVVLAGPPKIESAPKQFVLDMEKVKSITNETKEVAAILGAVMEEEPEAIVPLPKTVASPSPFIPSISDPGKSPSQSPSFKGLEASFQPVLARLLTRSKWESKEFAALASDFHFMPLAIRDTLNEWSDEALGDFIVDGEDPIIIHGDLLKKERD